MIVSPFVLKCHFLTSEHTTNFTYYIIEHVNKAEVTQVSNVIVDTIVIKCQVGRSLMESLDCFDFCRRFCRRFSVGIESDEVSYLKL